MTARESDRLRNLYALYASKNRLCTLCENTTPKKTAYNAYRNKNRRVRRAEGMKMYALKDAYGLHTKCIQAYKKRQERIILLTSSLYCLFFYLLLFASSGIPRRIMNKKTPLPVIADSWILRAFIARLTGCPPPSRPISCLTVIARFCGRIRNPVPSASLPGWTTEKVVCIVCIKKPTMHAMREHNSEKDCIQCIQKQE